jgi:Sulfotransferase family
MQHVRNPSVPELPPVIVVGTGRCGSTLLSTMIRQHPDILSLSELFAFVTDLGSLIPQSFPAGDVSATQFWDILNALYHKQNLMLRHGVAMDEVLYPFFSPSARFKTATGVPAIMQTTLPHLTGDYDVFYDEVRDFVATLSPAPIQSQYQRLFIWLRQRFNRRLWVERSGGSLRIISRLVQHFPEARFVHIIRDGRDCALSMSRHYGFRMVLIAFYLTEVLGVDPFEDADRSQVEDVSDEMFPFLPEHFDAEAFRNYDVSPSLYGHYWSGELMAGLPVLAQIPPSRLLTIRFEDFLSHPEDAVRTFISFVDPSLADEAWIHLAASQVRPVRSAWKSLAPHEQALLEAACQPGFQALDAFLQQRCAAPSTAF